MLNRRAFIVGAVGTLAAPLTVNARQEKVARIGVLSLTSPSGPFFQVFMQGLRDLGYVEGHNILLELRSAEGRSERLPRLAAELVRLQPDVIFAPVPQAALAAHQATKTIPIVIATVADPVGAGLVVSFAAPGGNVTGLSLFAPELVPKQLELLKEAAPKADPVAVLANPDLSNTPLMVTEMEAAARALGLRVQLLGVRRSDGFDHAFSTIARGAARALFVLSDPFLFSQRTRIVGFANQHRLPAIYPQREYAEAGGLMAYGSSVADNLRRAATYVGRILKGAKPADLPVELPTRFELVINVKTARALGLIIPPPLLLRADEVIG